VTILDKVSAPIIVHMAAASIRDRLDWAPLAHLSRWFASIEARPAVQRGLKAFQNPPE
jgi:GST-like protein